MTRRATSAPWLAAAALAAARICGAGVSAPLEPPGRGLPRGPYVEAVTGAAAFVCWRSQAPAPAKVEFRARGGPSRLASEPGRSRDHCQKLGGLEPSTAYEYRVELASEPVPPGRAPPDRWTAWHEFHSAEGPRAPSVHFAVLGDSGSGGDGQRRVARRLEEAAPDFILHVGDVVYDAGADADYDARYFSPYGALLDHVPVYIGIGNHDYGNFHRSEEEGRRWLHENFLVVHRLPPRAASEAPREEPTYYSFDRGPAHFTALDANRAYRIPAAPPLEPGSAQLAWLSADLAASTAAWKFVFFHEPVYSTGRHGNTDGFKEWLAPVLERGGVDVVFQGHDHDYERSVPLRDGKPDPRGSVYVVAGGGGAHLGRQNQPEAWSAVFQSRFSFVDVRIEGARLKLRAVDDEGRTFDRWEKTK